jgi:hypothetical protein
MSWAPLVGRKRIIPLAVSDVKIVVSAAPARARYDQVVRTSLRLVLNVIALQALLGCVAIWAFCASGELQAGDGRFRVEFQYCSAPPSRKPQDCDLRFCQGRR